LIALVRRNTKNLRIQSSFSRKLPEDALVL